MMKGLNHNGTIVNKATIEVIRQTVLEKVIMMNTVVTIIHCLQTGSVRNSFETLDLLLLVLIIFILISLHAIYSTRRS